MNAPIRVHPSHVMVGVPINNSRECENCWECECHYPDALAAECPANAGGAA